MSSYVEFVKAALKNPMQISTVFQTSPWLREMLLKQLPLADARLVIELGPGAGAITEGLLPRLPKDCQYVGIELNSHLVKFLHQHYPERSFIEGSAELCAQVTEKQGSADAVVSSLPWTVFPYEVQEKILQSIHKSLKPGGVFATYVCLNASLFPSAKNLRSLMKKTFKKVEKTPTEWRNIPPAFVYACTK